MGVGIAGAAVLGVVLFTGSEASGGADSPEAAVRKLATAAASEDVLGVIQSLAPDEVASLGDLYTKAVDKAAALGLIASAETPASGADLTAERLGLRAEMVHRDVAKVSILSGRLGVRFDPSRLGPRLRDVLGDEVEPLQGTIDVAQIIAGIEEESEDAPGSISGLYLMAVRRDGGWFVSPTYTVAEYTREFYGASLPDYDASRTNPPEGADSPAEAVEAFLRAGIALDVDRGIALVPPDELGVLLDYKAAILSAIPPGALEEARRAYRITLDSLRTSVSELGDGRAKVFVEAAGGAITVTDLDDGSSATASYSVIGTCIELTAEGDRETQCVREALEDYPEFDPGRAFLVAVEGDRGWYVSPVATLLEYASFALDRFGPAHLEQILRGF